MNGTKKLVDRLANIQFYCNELGLSISELEITSTERHNLVGALSKIRSDAELAERDFLRGKDDSE